MLPSWSARGHAASSDTRATCVNIISELKAQNTARNPLTFVTYEARHCNMATLKWFALKEQFTGEFTSPVFWTDLEQYRKQMLRAHFVVAFLTENPVDKFPSERFAAASLAVIRSLPDFEELSSIRSETEKTAYFVFKNVAFAGWKSVEGLSDTKISRKKKDAPLISQARASQIRLRYVSRAGEAPAAAIRVTSPIPQQTISISADGATLTKLAVPLTPAVADSRITLPAAEGEHEVLIEASLPPVKRKPSLVFQRLRLISGKSADQ
jgi:hypothetical protein